ncbi:O-antigen translocase [Alcanivorax jadensis]|uniref:O-antigen translocase n=1 Tax=Alcanivorax jadensis TaxID=64988 RepID=UPI002409E12D|nr:O-antigen translocase [Alcanivorax jadensis]MDF1637585.1 O-antigen translocase [Alcanivorax jadensis]
MSNTDSRSEDSHKETLKSSFIIGGSSLINIVVGLLRMKVVAMLLGPGGIGLIGLLSNLMSAGANLSALGLGNSGTRQIAEANAKGGVEGLVVARKALFACSLALALVGGGAFFVLSPFLAKFILDDASLSSAVGWLSLGLSLTVMVGSQKALLTGLRRIGDVAKIAVASSVVSALAGISALYLWGKDGIVLFIISTPLVGFLISYFYVAKLPQISSLVAKISAISSQSSELVRLGFSFMVASLSVLLGQLAVRSIVQHELGIESLGYFQAAWSISMTYIGFVLAAMGTDYFPRLTSVIHDHSAARKMVNDQAEIAILLAGPVLLAMLALTPWVIQILYTSDFLVATSVLRWQILGDVLKILCWPMGFVIVASGNGRLFMMKEVFIMSVFVACVWLMIPILGLEATGVGFFVMYAVNIPLVIIISRKLIGFRWSLVVKREAFYLVLSAFFISIMVNFFGVYGVVFGVSVILVMAARNILRLSKMADLKGPVGKLVRRFNLLGRKGL